MDTPRPALPPKASSSRARVGSEQPGAGGVGQGVPESGQDLTVGERARPRLIERLLGRSRRPPEA